MKPHCEFKTTAATPMTKRTYATISIYASASEFLDEIRARISIPPSSEQERKGLFSLSYSTRDQLEAAETDEHVAQLARALSALPDLLASTAPELKAASLPVTVRLWIYFETDFANSDFLLPVKAIDWLQKMQADVCVDVWNY